MKKTIEDYQEAIARIYALANKPEGLRNVSKMGDWLIEECTTALVKAGALVKSGDRGPVVFMWNPTRPERPTRGFCERIMRDVLERGRDRKHRARHPEPREAIGYIGVEITPPPVQETLFPPEESIVEGCSDGNKFITAGGEYFEIDDIYAVANGCAYGVHHSKQCGDFFSVKLTPSEADRLLEKIRERILSGFYKPLKQR